jgi:archaellum component FlaC
VAETQLEQLKTQVKNASKSISTEKIESTAEEVKQAFTNAGESIAGQIAGQVQGGIESLTQQVDAFKGELKDAKKTVEGLLSNNTASLENMATDMVNNALSGLTSKFGAKVEIQFGEPDENGVVLPIASSLATDTTGEEAIASVLSQITGLGVEPGGLQKIITDASPEGLLNAGKELVEGKIGAFGGADALKNLAKDGLKAVTDDLIDKVLPGILAGGDINKTVNKITNIDSDGLGELVYTYGTVTSSGPTDLGEFNAMIDNLSTNVGFDLDVLIKPENEVKQNLEAAKADVENLSGGKDPDQVIESVQTQADRRSRFSTEVSNYESIVTTRVAKNSEVGVVQGISAETLSDVQGQIRNFVSPKFITDAEVNRVINLSQGDKAEESEAVKLLYNLTKKDYNVIKAFLKSIDTTIFNSTRPPVSQQVFPDPYEIGSYQEQWQKGQNDPVFPYVSSVEELQAEIQFISREVDKVIVHWSETHTNKNIGSEEINAIHIEAGLDGIGYHYVIRRDGSLQRGRPVNIQGEHASPLSFDEKSLGVVFIGGINVPTGTPNSENFLSAQSLTRAQLNTFDHFCRAIYRVYPGISILGHNDIDDTGENIDPGFDVPDYVKTRFGK